MARASKKIKKEKDDTDDLAAHIQKIREKSEKASKKIAHEGLDITPRLAHNKKKMASINQEKIDNNLEGRAMSSKYENKYNKTVLKPQQRMSEELKVRIENKKKLNLKKINTIKVKKVWN